LRMQANSVSVIIPVYGDLEKWTPLSIRAFQSANNQTVKADRVIISTGTNITECRNIGLHEQSEFLIFLDADDVLQPNYIEEMLKGSGDIRVPAVHRHYENGLIDTDQKWYQPKPLMTGNYIVVSAMLRTSLFKQLNGFNDYESLEDWDLWLRAEELGAKFEQCPNAILNVSKRPQSRNSNISLPLILENAKNRRSKS
jgi:GT2 family glycosyltransferase